MSAHRLVLSSGQRGGGRRGARETALLVAALALAGCAVAGSEFLGDTHPVACRSTGLGSYALPRSLLQISVVNTTADGKTETALEGPTVRAVADLRHVYCLDYLANPTSHDIVDVKKTEEGLLSLVATDILDKSREIARTLTQTTFTLASGRRAETAGSTGTKSNRFRYEFDPFDHADMAAMNERLRTLGFCLINPDWSFDPQRAGINGYCNAPEQTVAGAPPTWVVAQARQGHVRGNAVLPTTPQAPKVTDARLLSGILYRPRLDHTLLILRKSRRGGWELARRETVLLENVSPIFSVGVSRAFFSERISVLRFDRGVLGNVCLYKGSELEAVASVPFLVASAIVALPATLIQVRINTTEDRRRLAEVEEHLADLQRLVIEAAAAGTNPSLPNAPGVGAHENLPSTVADAAFDKMLEEAGLDKARATVRSKTRKEAVFSDKAGDLYGCPASLVNVAASVDVLGFPQVSK
jgi:hypothetical protein